MVAFTFSLILAYSCGERYTGFLGVVIGDLHKVGGVGFVGCELFASVGTLPCCVVILKLLTTEIPCALFVNAHHLFTCKWTFHHRNHLNGYTKGRSAIWNDIHIVWQPTPPSIILIYTSLPLTSLPNTHISPSLFNSSITGP